MELRVEGNEKKLVLVVVLVAALLAVYAYAPSIRQSILPGFEGIQDGIYGYQPDGQTTSVVGAKLATPPGACSYAWNGSPTITSASVEVQSPQSILGVSTCAFPVADYLDLGAQENPVSYSPPFSQPIRVSYYVPVPGSPGKFQYVTGQVNEYQYSLNLDIQASSAGGWSFSGDTVWLNLASTTWNQASTDPANSSVTGQVFEAPLYGVVTDVQWTNQGDSSCSACTVGEALTFYSSPGTTGQTLVTLSQGAPSSSLNSSLSSVYSPDTRMQQLVYYPVTIEHMQNACNVPGEPGLGCSAPHVTITVTLYTLQVGQYILTNPDTTSLHHNGSNACTGIDCTLQGIGAWLSNPFNQFALALGGTLGLAIVVFVVIIVLFPGVLLIIFRRRGRPEEG